MYICIIYVSICVSFIIIGLDLFSGKSNLMDAVSFVLGERITNLRCKRLGVSTRHGKLCMHKLVFDVNVLANAIYRDFFNSVNVIYRAALVEELYVSIIIFLKVIV